MPEAPTDHLSGQPAKLTWAERRRQKAYARFTVQEQQNYKQLQADITRITEHHTGLKTLEEIDNKVTALKDQFRNGLTAYKALQAKIQVAEDELTIQEVGFTKLDFDLGTSIEYKTRMIQLQDQQKAMVKSKTACSAASDMTFNGSLAEGKKMVNKSVKMSLWAFNTQCDNVISKVTYRNRASSENKIRKAFDVVNANDTLSSITHEYLKLKLDELEATFRYKEQLEHEKDILRAQREEEREEKKLQQEIARERAKIEKDETHINTELARLQKLLSQERGDKATLLQEARTLQNKLQKLTKRKNEVDFREGHAKAGYVYIISNIGSFGKDVVKIGVTRRLEPLDRINELGDASVPFRFDIHALVFSDQAYALEASLHKRFAKQRLNQVNNRKEFFRVPLGEVQKAIVEEFGGASVEFRSGVEAKEFRQSIQK